MAIGITQNLAPGGGGVSHGTTFTYTPPVAFTAGSTVLLCFASFSESGQATGVTVGGNACTQDSGASSGNSHVEIWRVTNLPSAGDLVVTWSGTGAFGNFLESGILEVSGLVNVSPVDQSPAETNGTSTGPTITSGVTTQDNELVLACFVNVGTSDTTITQPGSYTPIMSNGAWTTDASGAGAYRIVSAAGAQTATWSLGTSVTWIAAMNTYKADASAPVVVAPTPLQVLTFGANF